MPLRRARAPRHAALRLMPLRSDLLFVCRYTFLIFIIFIVHFPTPLTLRFV